MKKLIDKHILLGITGGISAYKSVDLVRRLREAGCEVRVVMTDAAQQFVTPLTFQAVSGYPVTGDGFAGSEDDKFKFSSLQKAKHKDPLPLSLPPHKNHSGGGEKNSGMDHIALARWADVILIAPATADFMAKLAHGFADNVLSTLCVASEVPIIVAPAMNQAMWKNVATQANREILLKRGVQFLGPAEGSQACGEFGAGRMLEPAEIVTALENKLTNFVPAELSSFSRHCEGDALFADTAAIQKKSNSNFQKIKFLITAGPTQEPIDPVRYLTNRSSGKMGYALAQIAAQQGAQVTLISGPTALACPPGVTRVSVTTASQMYQAVMAQVKKNDVFISTAAVSDYAVKNIAQQKIKKNDQDLALVLTRNPDILSAVSALKKPPFTVGFAAETENLKSNALKKLKEKKLDMIAANNVVEAGVGFDADENELLVLWKNGEEVFPKQSKIQLAEKLLNVIFKHVHQR